MYKILSCLFCSVFLMCCTEKGTPLQGTSEHGYQYEIRKAQNSGATPEDGDLLLIYNGGFVGDKAVFGQFDKNMPPATYRLQNRKDIDTLPAIQQKDMWPIYDAFKLIGIGDSIFLWMPLDSTQQQNLPRGIDKGTKEIKLFMTIVDITTEEKEEAKKIAQKEALNKKLIEVQAFMKQEVPLVQNGQPSGTALTLDSGVKIWTQKEGRKEGRNEAIKEAEWVRINYYGSLMDGTRFDDSYSKGKPFSLKVGSQQVIPGMSEALLSLEKGSEALVFIPSALAYGEAGIPNASIPPNADLLFYIEVL